MTPKFVTTTDDEENAIIALEMVASIWPDSLWLYSACGTLCVMKKYQGTRVMAGEGFDQRQCICTIDIENDGGDW